MRKKLFLEIINKLQALEQRRQKTQEEEAELQFNIQRDIEKETKPRRERQNYWILHGGPYPE
jgi:hypothetical protein